jgi:iron-sulfur cluster assembly accessory protein
MSEKLYVTFGNEEKYKITQDTLVTYLENATIDYQSDLFGAQFTIVNPAATSKCGCGSSFSI